MAVAKKNKRKIHYKGQLFYWWVVDEFDGFGGMLSINIVSDDKKFLIKYFVIQKDTQNRYIIVIGEYFPHVERKTGNWVRFICPDFTAENKTTAITPKNIEAILSWCFLESKVLIPVNYKGEIIDD